MKCEAEATLDLQEIFLRELISNSSDALDKIKFENLKNKDKNLLESNPELYIHLIPDKTNNTLTLIDSGIGESAICAYLKYSWYNIWKQPCVN